VEGNTSAYVALLIGGKDGSGVLEKAARRADIVQYILVLAIDLINGMLSKAVNYVRINNLT